MKEIKAIIQPFRLEAVMDALRGVEGLPGVTVSVVTGMSAQRGPYESVEKAKLEIMVPDDLVERVVDVVRQAAHTGNPGDGRIFVIPIEQTVKVRTGERDTWH